MKEYMNKLKTERTRKGFSQSELALTSGVKLSTIQKYESGAKNIDSAKIDNLLNLSISLGCSIADIVENEAIIDKLKKARLV